MSVVWMLIRGSGLVAFGLLAGATIWGLLLSTKVLGGWAKAKPLTWTHEALSLGAVLATAVHMVALYAHDYMEFDAAAIFVPGASQWRPLAVAWGVTAFYGLIVVTFSFYLRSWIGQGAWRALHFASFGTFVGAAIHGITAGTDSTSPWVMALYAGSLTAVVLLIVVRATASAAPDRARPTRQIPVRPTAAD